LYSANTKRNPLTTKVPGGRMPKKKLPGTKNGDFSKEPITKLKSRKTNLGRCGTGGGALKGKGNGRRVD